MEDAVAQPHGLIRTERLDRLALRRSESRNRRSDDLSEQLALAGPSAKTRARHLVTLRFSCEGWAFAFIREGVLRFPIEHTRFSRPLPGDSWWRHPKAPHRLEPNPAGDSHPYPVEFDLPPWTLRRDMDLRTWLLGFAGGVRIEAPAALRAEHQERARAVLAAYGPAEVLPQGGPEPEDETPVRFFPNRLRRG